MRIRKPVREPLCVTDPDFYRHLEVQLFIDSHYNDKGVLAKKTYEVYLQRHRKPVWPEQIPGLGHWQRHWQGTSDCCYGVLTIQQLTHLKLDLYVADRDERPLPASSVL